ncbi:NACHT domain-containing protein [Alkalinema pantanalense CENA528]|uniref:NACHT domain-containing protein n=1 Tax=Alkalinema pantanalense TaxID=1620705 RepID=UPI003D6F5533
MVFDPLTKALDLLMGSQLVKDKLQRNEHVIRFLKQLGLSPEQPPADFEGVYAYALVEYGVGKPKPCLEIFRQSEIRKIFRTAFGDNNARRWLRSGEQFLDQSEIGQAVRSIGLDPKRELAAFAACFITVTKQTRNPSEVLLSHQVSSVQQQIQQVIERLDRLPSLEGIRTELASLAGSEAGLLPASLPQAQSCRAFALGQQMRGWFETLGYRFESYEVWETNYFEWIINIPVRRGRYDRVLVRGVDGEVGIRDVRSLAAVAAQQKTDEGWIVTARRISQAARNELEQLENQPDCAPLAAFTLDELLDQDADFSGYLDWLAAEIEQRGIEARYVPLACTKEEVDPITHQRLGISRYGAAEGWTEGYLDRWLDDPAKEHLSILGEFGTGKTWLTLHYAAQVLRQYREAQAKGMARPRLPIVVPLRDYAKAVSVESLFSEFFFRKHEIPIPGYSAFEQLNRMGKLLLIFDGFDEMAARVDKQQMINNFWELAKVVVPGAKVILTCRTEHFPEAREGRALLNAELQASTRDLTGETPQFEVLELEKFDDDQIRQVLQLQATEATVDQVMGNPQLLDLARRPVMTELILEALPDIEAGKPVDMSRVYLYAVRRKMERDIKAERTFTSMADKLYFLCELSWEMLSTDRMSLNYREFPDRIRKLFGAAVQEEKDLDHWHYDMMGQTMLIRNADGDYTPAHRSLLEFFVAFKFAAELGALAPDFLELSQMRGDIDQALEPREYTWSEYFETRSNVAPLADFKTESLEKLRSGFGRNLISRAVSELMLPLLASDAESLLWNIITATKHKTEENIGYVGGNAMTVLIQQNPIALMSKNLAYTVLQGADFSSANLRDVDLTNADLAKSTFTQAFGTVLCSAVNPSGTLFATGETGGRIHLWSVDLKQEVILNGHGDWVRSLVFTSDGLTLISTSSDQTIKIWDIATATCTKTLTGHHSRVYDVSLLSDNCTFATVGADCNVKIWHYDQADCLHTLTGHTDIVWSVAFSKSEELLITTSRDCTIKLWVWRTGECIQTIKLDCDRVNFANFIHDDRSIIVGVDHIIQIIDLETQKTIQILEGHSKKILCFSLSPNQKMLASSSYDQTIRIWNLHMGRCVNVIDTHTNIIRSVTFYPNGKELLSGSDDRSLCLWDISSGRCLKARFGQVNGVNDIALSPEGTFLVNTNDDETIGLWNLDCGEYLKTFQGHTKRVWSVAVSSNGKFIASASSDRTIKIWDLATGECLRSLHCPSSVFGVVISSDGKKLLSSGSDQLIILWDLETGQRLREVQDSSSVSNESSAIALSNQFIAASDKNEIHLWDYEVIDPLRTFRGHTGSIWAIVISPNEQWIATGSFDTTIKLWDIHSGALRLTLEGHSDRIRAIAVNSAGTIMASAGDDTTIRLWDIETGTCQKVFTGHESRIRGLAFHPNNQWLVSGSFDETIRVWSIVTGQCIKKLVTKLYAGMNITGVKGLTPATIASLKALGAVEDDE